MHHAATTPNAAATPPHDPSTATPPQNPPTTTSPQAPPIAKAAGPAVRHHGWLADRWARWSGPHRERGMSTAEYAVGTRLIWGSQAK